MDFIRVHDCGFVEAGLAWTCLGANCYYLMVWDPANVQCPISFHLLLPFTIDTELDAVISTRLQTRAADPALRHEVLTVLDAAKDLGLTTIRTWAFADGTGWNHLQPECGVWVTAMCEVDKIWAACLQHCHKGKAS